MNAITPESLQLSLYLPPPASESLQEYVDVYHSQPEGESSKLIEEAVARKLAVESHRHFRDIVHGGESAFTHNGVRGVSTNYRAVRAAQNRVGNCGAHSEDTGVMGLRLGLDMRHSWDGTHVNNLWHTRKRVWLIDGQSNTARPLYIHDHLHTQHLELDALYQSRLYLRRIRRGSVDELEATPVLEKLNRTAAPTGTVLLVLSVAEGVQMIAAMGDQAKFRALGRLSQISPEDQDRMRALMPRPRLPISAVKIPEELEQSTS